jgi:hypothetical protein
MAAVGVRLCEAPDAPSRSEVRFRILSGQRSNGHWRAALGDIHPSGDIRSLPAPGTRPGRIMHAAISWMRASTGMAEYTTAALMQGYGDSGSRVAVSGEQLPPGDLASWKDPL